MKITAIAREDLKVFGSVLNNEMNLETDDKYGNIIPDLYCITVGREYEDTGELESFFKSDKENGDIEEFNKTLENCKTLLRKRKTVFNVDTNEEKAVIDYMVSYDIKESTKNVPTYTESYVDYSYTLNGNYLAKYELLFTAGDNITLRLTMEHKSNNVPMIEIIEEIKDLIFNAIDVEEDSENPFSKVIKNHGDYNSIIMFDEFGNITDIEFENTDELCAMLVSIRQIACYFVEE